MLNLILFTERVVQDFLRYQVPEASDSAAGKSGAHALPRFLNPWRSCLLALMRAT